MSVQSEAAKTAGERLSAIEAWSRWTAIAATAAAVFLAGIAGAVGYVTYDYIQVKRAASGAIEKIRENQALEAHQGELDRKAKARANQGALQSAPKKTPPDLSNPSPVLALGDEAVVYINGDECDKEPGLCRSGIIKDDSIVLIFPWEEYGDPGWPDREKLRTAYDVAIIPYANAKQADDPDGIEVLIQRGYAVRVSVGTRVRVVPAKGAGGVGGPLRNARIAEGDHKGKVVNIPTRNLRAPVK
jgi:hypothetical protein